MAYLEIENLAKSYDGKTVLNSFSVSLEKGQILCLIGDSGSGKTTFLRLVNFLTKKDAGKIFLDGKEITKEGRLTTKERQAQAINFGLVFQSFNLFPQYTVMQNILLPIKTKVKKTLKEKKLSRKDFKVEYNKIMEEKLKEADNLLLKVNLQDKKDSFPNQLSGGEAQRVAIIRALMLDPKVLCFDEPTSALDPRLKRQVASTILSLKEQGHTIIVVTHEMELASAVADQVIFLEKGNIIEKGGREILLNPQSDELKNFLSLEQCEEINNGQTDDPETERARGTLFSLSQD
jgi:polar amino acid transport system ATP-binding protein